MTASDPEALSVTTVEQPTTPPSLLSKPPTKREAYDDIEAIYENLTFRETDPMDVVLQKALIVRQYHKDMKEKVQFMKKYYQYPIDPDEELDCEEGRDEEGVEWDEDGEEDSDDLEGSDWVGSNETGWEETTEKEQEEVKEEKENKDVGNKECYMDLLWSAIMQRRRATNIDVEEFEDNKDQKEEEEKGNRDDIENEKECHMDLLRRAIIQRQRALGIYVDEKSDNENDKKEKEEKEEEKEEEEEEAEQHKKYCFSNKHKQESHMICLKEAILQRQSVLQGHNNSSERNTGTIENPDSEEN